MLTTANFLWNGRNLSLYEYACIASFVKNDFTVQVFTFDTQLVIPEGAIHRDAKDIMDENQLYSYTLSGQKGSMAGFADAFRCNLLKKEGGWWFDADMLCLQNAKFFKTLLLSKEIPISMGFQNAKYINNAVLYADDQTFVDGLITQLKKNGQDVTWGENGPRLTTKVATELGYMAYADPTETYFPVDGHELIKIFDPDYRQWCINAFKKSLAMHLWNDTIRRLTLPKNILPPDGSYALEMFLSYCPELKEYPRLPVDTMRSLFKYLQLQNVTQSRTVSSVIKARESVRLLLKSLKL